MQVEVPSTVCLLKPIHETLVAPLCRVTVNTPKQGDSVQIYPAIHHLWIPHHPHHPELVGSPSPATLSAVDSVSTASPPSSSCAGGQPESRHIKSCGVNGSVDVWREDPVASDDVEQEPGQEDDGCHGEGDGGVACNCIKTKHHQGYGEGQRQWGTPDQSQSVTSDRYRSGKQPP